MAHLANCPHCDHELLIPAGTSPGSSVRCPSCRAAFSLEDARSREIATVEVAEPVADADDEIPHAGKTVEDLASMPTWDSDSADDLALQTNEELEPASAYSANENNDLTESDELHVDEDLDFSDFDALLEDGDVNGSAKQDVAASGTSNNETEHTKYTPQLHIPESDDLDALHQAAPPAETPEAAAQRIDAWFRSAKTLADVPALDSESVDYSPAVAPQEKRETSPANHATIDLTVGEDDELHSSDDFELDTPDAAHTAGPAWDDPQHMDKLLADFQNQPHAESALTSHDSEAPEPAHSESANEWTPDESMKITPASDQPRRKKSLVRTLLMTTVGGLMGLALGYYALLWIRGPEIDVLEAGKFLPKAMLPSAFNSKPRELAVAPTQPKVEEPAEPATEEPAPVTDAAKTADNTETTPATESAEKAASFTEPVDVKSAVTPDATGNPVANLVEKPAEPATFDAPSAEPMKQDTAAAKLQVAGAPSFAAADLAAALQAGKEAEAGLVNGNLADGREVARAKGFSYSILADLAQKAIFANPASSAEASTLGQSTQELFRNLLARPHARDEVAQIVPKWITSPNRRQGGVFFAGTVISHESKGTADDLTLKLGEGQTLRVLASPKLAEQLQGSTAPVAILGWIVEKPAQQIEGYTGSSEQAVYAGKLIPLE
jgi:hypothetical protein